MTRIAFLIPFLFASVTVVADELPRTISVSGEGTAQTTPDRAIVSLTIVARNQSVAGAQQEAAEVVARVLALAEELDIPEGRVDTMSATVYPDYRYDQVRQEQELRGYISQRQMRIEIHDLEKVGVIVERAIEQGVNQVSPPQLISSRRREAYREALEEAVEDARANAERLASALGVTLGPAIQVSAGPSYGPPTPYMRASQAGAAMAMQAAPETYSAGDMSVTANITVVFELSE
jgi:uncharacterized protein YggE